MQEGVGDFVSYEERDGVVQWLGRLSHDLHFCPEVYFRAANLLDSFLSLMKVRLPQLLLGQEPHLEMLYPPPPLGILTLATIDTPNLLCPQSLELL